MAKLYRVITTSVLLGIILTSSIVLSQAQYPVQYPEPNATSDSTSSLFYNSSPYSPSLSPNTSPSVRQSPLDGVPIYPAPAYQSSGFVPQADYSQLPPPSFPPTPSTSSVPPTQTSPVVIPPIHSLPPEYAKPQQQNTAESSDLIQSKLNRAELIASEEVRKYEAIQEAKKNNDELAWKKPLPDYRGPFLARLENNGKNPVAQVSFDEMYDRTLDQNKEVYSWEKDEDHHFDWSLLDPITFINESKKWVGLGPDQKKAEAAMEAARKLMADGKYHEAGKQFEKAAKRWPDTVLEEDARFFAGECYYQIKEYYRAFENYDRLISNFSSSKHKDAVVKNIYQIARHWVKSTEEGAGYINPTDKSRPTYDTFGAAVKAYKSITINDPRGPLADESMLQLGFAYMNRGKYQGDSQYAEAAFWFKQLRENARKHEYATRGAYLEVVCRQKAGDGAEYNTAPLDEAKELADQTLTQYGTSLKDNRENLMHVREDIIEQAAEHRWTLGQYYDKQKYYGSAKMYYQEVLKEYPTSKHAELAKKRLEEIKDYPDEPPTFTQQMKSLLTLGRGVEK